LKVKAEIGTLTVSPIQNDSNQAVTSNLSQQKPKKECQPELGRSEIENRENRQSPANEVIKGEKQVMREEVKGEFLQE
jgi:hypothetical protein